MKTDINSKSAWSHVNWKDIYKIVFILQQKIFYYSKLDDLEKVHKYQILLVNSFKSKLLAVRQITQDNKGKKSVRIDGVKSISLNQRWELAQSLKLDGTVMPPIRRVFVSKQNGEKRPLNIPTLTDRIKQKLVLLAIEPQWEAKFDANSYGFRPGRCSHDAIEAVYKSINRKPKYVLDADIEKCFDKIGHKSLLKKLDAHPKLTKQIDKWLKTGVLDLVPSNSSESLIKETLEDTPQSGVISPLLANIALDGMEKRLKNSVIQKYGVRDCKSLTVIRYADDIVIVHSELKIIKFCKTELSIFLAELNLRLNQAKTNILHTLELNNITQTRGFEFLGFHIRQLPIGKYKRKTQNRPYRTLIVPSKKSIDKHIENLRTTLKRNVKSEAIISQLNPKIIGWSTYFRSGVSFKIFNYLDHKLLKMVLLRLKQIHKTRSTSWIYKRYFERINKYKWTFYHLPDGNNKAMTLARHTQVKILRHVKVKESFSVYDNNLGYWSQRLKKIPTISNTTFKLLKKQKGKCILCCEEFKHGDIIMEIDHIRPLSIRGKKITGNIRLVHRHCSP